MAALADPAWQVRAGAATALSSADPGRAVPPLTGALDDPNADVRKAAVLALLRHPGHAAAREALAGAVADRDADVRAYAGRGWGSRARESFTRSGEPLSVPCGYAEMSARLRPWEH